MAGRLKGFRDQLQRLAQQTHALADELEDMTGKYSRMRAGEWHECSDAAWLALDSAGENLESLVLMARDLAETKGDPLALGGPTSGGVS